MTIDEAIAHAREVAEEQRKACDLAWVWDNPDNIKKCAEEHEQLAEWLEDYKQIKMLVPIEQALKTEYNKGYSKAENDYYAKSEKDRQSSYDCGYDAGYSKAIDDFAELVKEMYAFTILEEEQLNEIAKQLKVGNDNE